MKAWEVLENKGWTQFAMAEDANGRSFVDVDSEHAVKFCAVGAIIRSYGPVKGRRVIQDLVEDLPLMRNGVRYAFMSAWNDDRGRTKDEVVRFLKEHNV